MRGRKKAWVQQQAIHPAQVDIIHSTFVPTENEILRTAKILHRMEVTHSSQKGAFSLEMEGGGKEIIDDPMLKRASLYSFFIREVPHSMLRLRIPSG